MRKNRVKISQSKPKKVTTEQLTNPKSVPILKDSVSAMSDFSDLDIPAEPAFRLPIIAHTLNQNPLDAEIKNSSNEFGEEKSDQKEEALFEDSQSNFELTTEQMLEDYSEINSNQPKDLISQIQELQQELSDMSQRILYTEEEMKCKETEAHELKELLVKLKENQFLIMESSEAQSNCKACLII